VFQRINIVMDAYEHVKEPADKTKSWNFLSTSSK
jgi:hypothetical protein